MEGGQIRGTVILWARHVPAKFQPSFVDTAGKDAMLFLSMCRGNQAVVLESEIIKYQWGIINVK